MPARPPAQYVSKMVVSGTAGTTNWANVYYFQTPGHALTVADYTFIYAYIETDLLRPYIHNMDVLHTVTGVDFQDLTSSSGASYFVNPNVIGTNAGTALPASCCVLISHAIARRFRGGHPRHYLPFGQNTDTVDNVNWTNTFLTNVQNDMNDFFTQVHLALVADTGSGEMGSLSYYSALAPRVTPEFDPFLSSAVKPRVCSQRRRLGKIGG